jgi:hypothetical protein
VVMRPILSFSCALAAPVERAIAASIEIAGIEIASFEIRVFIRVLPEHEPDKSPIFRAMLNSQGQISGSAISATGHLLRRS